MTGNENGRRQWGIVAGVAMALLIISGVVYNNASGERRLEMNELPPKMEASKGQVEFTVASDMTNPLSASGVERINYVSTPYTADIEKRVSLVLWCVLVQ